MIAEQAEFIERYGLWTEEQKAAAKGIQADIEKHNLRMVRVSWGDQHGILRGKTLMPKAFLSTLQNGLDFTVSPIMFDTANDIAFNPFVPGGGFGMPEMTGCPDAVLVPDPLTFRILPWAPNTGWILSDMYFTNGTPVPFSTREVLRKALNELRERGFEYIAGLEVECYITKLEDPMLSPEHMGGPGQPGEPPRVSVLAHGFQHQMESNNDAIDSIVQVLLDNLLKVGLPVRTLEDEWGPSQVEITFDPMPGMETADSMLLFRTATKQICARHGYHVTFMCQPALQGFFSSGWHLHQSLVNINTGENAFMPNNGSEPISELGRHFVGGILKHGSAASLFTTPTINGYKRRKPFSLAPDRTGWGLDNRGMMIRVTGELDDPTSHIENRVGEPAANPYLYMASQIIAGLDGIDNKIDPGPMSDEPYGSDRPLLPKTLMDAIAAVKQDSLYRDKLGDEFMNFIIAMKEHELGRFLASVEGQEPQEYLEKVTDWEQREYFRVF